MSVTTFKWSIDQWHQLIETGLLIGQNVELLEGEIVKISPEGIPHSYTNYSIGKYLLRLLEGKAVIRESYPITLNDSEPQPDISIVRLPETIYRNHHPYVEDIYWLIEISKTTLQFDLEVKAQVYARNKIPEYWVVDLKNKKLIVHTLPKGDSYQQILETSSGTIVTQSFPDLKIELSNILLF